jgi:hypothetical protein
LKELSRNSDSYSSPPANKAPATSGQLSLFSPDRLPRKPYCTDEYGPGIRWRIRQVDQALRHRHIQPNTPTVIWRLIFDIDRPGGAFAFEQATLPPPNWAATNPSTGNAHLAYEVEVPVSMLDASTKAAKLLIAIERAFGNRLSADHAFNGRMCKNPLHSHWKVVEFRQEGYSLTELAEWVGQELSAKKPAKRRGVVLDPDSETYCVGRNFATFETLRKWAYSAVRDYWYPGGNEAWHRAVRDKIDSIWCADSINWAEKDHSYSDAERADTSKGVATWVWDRFTPAGWREFVAATHTPEQQAKRGKKGGQASGAARRSASEGKREQARQMAASGMSQRAIAAELGVSQQAVSKWLRDTTEA